MGPFSQYIYAETPGYIEYIIIGIWLALLVIAVFMFYTLNRSMNAVLEERKRQTPLHWNSEKRVRPSRISLKKFDLPVFLSTCSSCCTSTISNEHLTDARPRGSLP